MMIVGTERFQLIPMRRREGKRGRGAPPPVVEPRSEGRYKKGSREE